MPSTELPERGDLVAYRSFAGDVWLADVTDVISGATFAFVDIDVRLPSGDPLHLRAVRWWNGGEIEHAGAGWPKSPAR